MPIEFFSAEKEKRKIAQLEREYPREFGNVELEEMAKEFLSKNFSIFERVEKAPEEYDLLKATDFIAKIKGNGFLAIQFTSTDSPERRFKKVRQVLETSCLDWEKERVPLVLLYAPKKIWGEAYNEFLEKKLASPLEALPDQQEIKEEFLEQMEANLVIQSQLHPENQALFEQKLKFLKKESETIT